MPTKPQPDSFSDLHFPAAGTFVSCPFGRQPNLPVTPDNKYARTTPLGVNVRGYEPSQNRLRGGSRPGFMKYLPVQPGGVTWITQELNTIVTDQGSSMQVSQAGRVVYLVTVSQGNVYYCNPGDTSWTEATNNTGESPPLNFSGVLFSAANNQNLYFADGINQAYFSPNTQSVELWVASAGSLPVDADNNTPRLIDTWRGRTVVSGLILDPQNWFMSAVSDPTNWDYFPLSTSPTQAVAGNNSPLGFVGDVITTLIPYNDDVLIFGGDHTIWMCQGDPMAGGQIDLVTDAIGMAWGKPWCKDPYGTVYFVSNRTGIYTFVPGQLPVRISQPIEFLLQRIQTGTTGIRLIWDDRFQGLHVFVTPLAAPGAAMHFFYEQRTGAWWTDVFANPNHNPLCCVTLDGNDPGDRVPLIGSWDGYVRTLSATATDDDGTPISSSVVIGPMLTQNLDEMLVKDLQAILGTNSNTVTYAVFVGTSAEQALSTPAVATGTWGAGRNLLTLIRRSGHAVYIQLSSTKPWFMEEVRARLTTTGKVRMRGR